jgi:feruloyl esterase
MRLFMVPGVQHCVGGPGSDALGQIGAPAKDESAQRSVGAAIQHWVETGRTPESITARRDMITAMMRPGQPERQRLICAFPKRAALTPGADPDKEASYHCMTPKD